LDQLDAGVIDPRKFLKKVIALLDQLEAAVILARRAVGLLFFRMLEVAVIEARRPDFWMFFRRLEAAVTVSISPVCRLSDLAREAAILNVS
jgi:hypothetical protein